MSPDSWEKQVNPDAQYRYNENIPQVTDRGNGSWHPEGETLRQHYNNIRDSEIRTRNGEIFENVIHFYFSGKGVIVLVLSIVLCLITPGFFPEGLFFWNIVLFFSVWGFSEITVRKEVRAEWDDIEGEMKTFWFFLILCKPVRLTASRFFPPGPAPGSAPRT